MSRTRLAVLVSGVGTNLEAMLKQGLPVEFVLADRPCTAFNKARDAGIHCALIKRSFSEAFDRVRFTQTVLGLLRVYNIDLVAMAGFMTILAPEIFADDAYGGKIVNTHPSLPPHFKGHDAVAQTLSAGVAKTGCTIHWATPDLDAGAPIARGYVPVLAGDTVETLHERIRVVERKLYPSVLEQIIAGRESAT